MTVSAQTPINRSTGNGVTTVFPYTFKIIAAGDIEVSVDDVVKTLNVDYTVSGAGVDAGGNVTMAVAPASLTTVVRRRNMALTRTTDYQDQGALPAATLDNDIDAPVLMIQQLDERLDRTFSLPVSSSASTAMPAPTAGYVLGWDALGERLTNLPAQVGSSLIDLAASGGSALVGYMPSGGGAVATDVQSKLRADDAGPTTVGNGTAPYPLASFYSNKDITQHAWYDFLADGTMDYTGNVEPIVGHATFNDNKTIQGTLGFDHHHSYQAYPHYNASGTLNRLSCYWSLPDVTAGTVTELSQHKASNALGAGTITKQYGFYCEELTRGAANWAFYSAGNTVSSYFGGGVSFGRDNAAYATISYSTSGSLVIKGRLDSGGFPIRMYSSAITLGGNASTAYDARIENSATNGDLEITARSGYRINLKSNIGSLNYAEGATIIGIYGAVGGVAVKSASANVYSGTDAAFYVAANTVSSRSINAGGTVNASGADYAEYENNNGLSIAKGAVVGFKVDGTLTLIYSEAIRFGIKSTDPSLVGGDVWGNADQIGLEPVAPLEGEDTTQYLVEKGAWVDRLEAARKLVDRIAYSGKVPCNVLGTIPGGYIIAADDAGTITGAFVAEPDFAQYKKAVGRVNRILEDGRCEVAVMVH